MTKSKADSKLMTQKDIAVEYGVPARDVLVALHRGDSFPKPVQVIGRKWWFRRSDVVRFFKDRPCDQPADPGTVSHPPGA